MYAVNLREFTGSYAVIITELLIISFLLGGVTQRGVQPLT